MNDKGLMEQAEYLMGVMKLPYHIRPSKTAQGYWDIKKNNTIVCGSLTGGECLAYVKGIEDIMTDIELGDYELEKV